MSRAFSADIAADARAVLWRDTGCGEAGTAYLCRPFLVHAAQPHRGSEPRFLAQPPLLPASPRGLDIIDHGDAPVERAIRAALA